MDFTKVGAKLDFSRALLGFAGLKIEFAAARIDRALKNDRANSLTPDSLTRDVARLCWPARLADARSASQYCGVPKFSHCVAWRLRYQQGVSPPWGNNAMSQETLAVPK